MPTNSEKTPKEHIETVITEQSLSITSLKEMKNRIVSARAITKKQLDEVRTESQRLETELGQISSNFELYQKGRFYHVKKYLQTLIYMFLPIEIIAALYSLFCFAFGFPYYYGFLFMNASGYLAILFTCMSDYKKIFGKSKRKYQEELGDLTQELECSKSRQQELENTLEGQLERVVSHLNAITYQESLYYENIAIRNAKLREERKKLLADVVPTTFKQYVKIK